MSKPSIGVGKISPSRKTSLMTGDLTRGSIVKNLLKLSWPMIIMEALYMVSQIWDMIWVGKGGGSAAIAAVGVGGIIIMVISTFNLSFSSGSRAIVARFIGAKDYENARKAIGQAYLMSACWAVLVMVFGSLFIKNLLTGLGLDTSVVDQGVKYLRVLLGGWISLEILVIGLYSLQATGDSFYPMVIELFMRAIHLVLTPLLVMGYLFFPAMGISGAAIANVAAQSVGAIAALILYFSGRSNLQLTPRSFIFIPGLAWRMLKIGFPSLISILQMNLSQLLLTKIIAPFGTNAITAQSIVGNIQGFIYTPCLGMGNGVAVTVGQNVGAKQPERAIKSTWLGAGILEGFLLACGVFMLIFTEKIIGIFNNDPELIFIGAAFMRIATASYLVMGINTALQNCISGSGDTLPYMIINGGMIWIIQIPFTLLLANHTSVGVLGVRWAMVISSFIGTAVYFLYFKSGRWINKKV